MNDNSKRTVTAIVLSILVIICYMNMFAPKVTVDPNSNIVEAKNVEATNQVVSNNNVQNSPSQNSNGQVTINNTINNNITDRQIPSLDVLKKGAKKFVTNVAEFEISGLGGKIISYKLRKYPNELKSEDLVELIDVDENAFYPLTLVYNGQRDDFIQYNVSIDSESVNKIDDNTFEIKDTAKITLSGIDANQNNKEIKKVISINSNSYLFDVSSPTLTENDNAWIEWEHKIDTDNKDRYNEFSILYLNKEKNKVKKIGFKEKYMPVQDLGENMWISAGYKYFTSTLISQASTNNIRYGVIGKNFIFQGKLDSLNHNIKMYLGPKDREILSSEGFSLDKNIDLGFFSIIASPLLYVLTFFYKMLGNYGLAIILLTLIIKLLFLPLTSSSMKSMKKMADLQPKIQELRSRIKDPTQLNQEVMNLYKRYNINPLGGCVPMLIQIPVFFGLYSALLNSISLRHSSFALWITDLSAPEKLNIFGIGVPVMILLMGASMFIQQLTTPTAADPAQKKAMLLTPIIFTGIFLVSPFPSGLVLYWLTNNLISIVQQKILKSEGDKISPLNGTLIGSAIIFGLGYILTLF